MNKSLLIVLPLLPLLLSGCNKKSNSDIPFDGKIYNSENEMIPYNQKADNGINNKPITKNFNYGTSIGEDSKISESRTYSNHYFLNSSYQYNKDVASYAFGLSLATQKLDKTVRSQNLKEYMTEFGFDHLSVNEEYDLTPTEDSVGFGFGHKQIDYVGYSFDFVQVVIRGFDYEREWSSDFKLGKQGNHVGFEESAEKVLNGLNDYLKENNFANPLMLLITGYSRGGDIALLTGMKINQLVDDKQFDINKTNLFIYGFAVSNIVDENIDNEYKNIFIINNSHDFITKFVPAKYHLKRVGQEIDLYKDNTLTLVKNKDKTIEVEPFAEYTLTISGLNFNMEKKAGSTLTVLQFYDKIFDVLLSDIDADNPVAGNREKYADNLQPQISYLFSLIFGLTDQQRSSFLDTLTNNPFALLFIYSAITNNTEGALYSIFSAALDEAGATYDENQLRPACNMLQSLLHARYMDDNQGFLDFIATLMNNMNYILVMHSPISASELLKIN